MTFARLRALLDAFPPLCVAVAGDFCLDRYLELDGEHRETSLETGLPVFKVDRVRSQAGAAGTILNNLVALGAGHVHPIGFYGEDGEGFELERALASLPGVSPEGFLRTPLRRTFTYCKPLVLSPSLPPRELNRLDSKNHSPTPPELTLQLQSALQHIAPRLDALVLMDQVDVPGTGVLHPTLLQAAESLGARIPVFADSRNGFAGFTAHPGLILKMNRAEFCQMTGLALQAPVKALGDALSDWSKQHRRRLFVTLAEAGILGAAPGEPLAWVPALPVRGPLDIVGAGDSVTAALSLALAAGAQTLEAMELAMLTASVTIHKLGTTGTASPEELKTLHASLHR